MAAKQVPKILPPDLPDAFETLDAMDAAQALFDDCTDASGLRFAGIPVEGLRARRAAFRGCVFERCAFLENDVSAFEFVDCAFRGCDFSGARLDGATILRAAFQDCRAVGAYFPDAVIRHATFDNCRMNMANFGMAKLTGVAMRGCDLSGASFGYAKLQDVRWERCRLTGAELFQVKLAGMNLSTDEIDGIVLGDRSELEGAIVSAGQAMALAALLGVTIEG